MIEINKYVRKNVLALAPYSTARSEFKGQAALFLDANENPYPTNLNRYPDPLQINLKKEISKLRAVKEAQIFVGNGSDEIIDLLFRAFCEPQQDKAYYFTPTYGMYKVSAVINNVTTQVIPLNDNFELPPIAKIKTYLKTQGLLFICNPNNPTGNSVSNQEIVSIANNFNGIVVVDEAYIDFSSETSAISLITNIPNIIIIQTFSKAFGLAGARVGMAFSNPKIIAILNKIKPPYNVNTLSIDAALNSLKNYTFIKNQIETIINQRDFLQAEFTNLNCIAKVYPSNANFLLVEFKEVTIVFKKLLKEQIVVRNRTQQIKNCLRITIGTPSENKRLLNILKSL